MPGKNEPFFASLANPTLKSRDSITYPAVIMILRFAGLLMRMMRPILVPIVISQASICLPIVGIIRLTEQTMAANFGTLLLVRLLVEYLALYPVL